RTTLVGPLRDHIFHSHPHPSAAPAGHRAVENQRLAKRGAPSGKFTLRADRRTPYQQLGFRADAAGGTETAHENLLDGQEQPVCLPFRRSDEVAGGYSGRSQPPSESGTANRAALSG